MWDSASWELNYDSELFTSFSSYVNIVALFIIVFKMTWNTRRCGFRFINGRRLIYSWPWLVRNWYLLSLSFCYDFEHVLSFRGSQEKAYLPTNYDTFGFISGPNVFSKLVQCLLSSFKPSFQYGFKICVVCVRYLNGGECLQWVWKLVETVAPHFSFSSQYFRQFCSASLEGHLERG